MQRAQYDVYKCVVIFHLVVWLFSKSWSAGEFHPSIHVYLHQEKSHNCKQDREAGQKGQRTTLTTALKPN